MTAREVSKRAHIFRLLLRRLFLPAASSSPCKRFHPAGFSPRRLSSHFRLWLYFLVVPDKQVLKLVPLFIFDGCGFWTLHPFLDGDGCVYQAVLKLSHISFFSYMIHVVLMPLSFSSRTVADQRGIRSP